MLRKLLVVVLLLSVGSVLEAVQIPPANITASASSEYPGRPPQNTVNESGLDASDIHDQVATNAWLSYYPSGGSGIGYGMETCPSGRTTGAAYIAFDHLEYSKTDE